jgi:hypothetical protein
LDKAEATNIRTEALKSAEAAVVEAFAMADAAEEAEQDLAYLHSYAFLVGRQTQREAVTPVAERLREVVV